MNDVPAIRMNPMSTSAKVMLVDISRNAAKIGAKKRLILMAVL